MDSPALHWNSLTCSNPHCSKRCDDIAFQGINISLSSCGHFYCNNCSFFFTPNNGNFKNCGKCKSRINYFTKLKRPGH